MSLQAASASVARRIAPIPKSLFSGKPIKNRICLKLRPNSYTDERYRAVTALQHHDFVKPAN